MTYGVNILNNLFMRLIISILLLMMTIVVYGQSSKKKKNQRQETSHHGQQPTTMEPYYPEKKYGPKKTSRKKSKGPTYQAEQEYYERLEALDKTRRKNEKMMMTPQYSDPTYFGHKRPPKRRPPGKMKFCKECGIRH